jgi:hypothetical protein
MGFFVHIGTSWVTFQWYANLGLNYHRIEGSEGHKICMPAANYVEVL